MAGTGPGNLAEIIPTLFNAVLGTKFKIVRGYPAANESMLAMERGEVEGATVNWTTVKTAKAQWLRENKVRVIVQHLPTRGPDLPDVPALGELGDTTEGHQLLSLYANTGPIGRAFFAPPGTPAATVKTLRDGFMAMTKDPEFVADAKKINAELDIGTGDDVLKAVQQTLNVPEPVLQRAREIFGR
jgi:tripartite-type tricarboxylate transporter receptor subunit TctC